MKKKLRCVITALCMILCFTGCSEGDTTTQNSTKETESSTPANAIIFQGDSSELNSSQVNQQSTSTDLESGIDIQYKTINNNKRELCVFITNNTGRRIDELEVQALFRDQNGKTVSETKDGHDVFLPNTTVVSYIKSDVDYSNVEFIKTIEPDRNPRYENHMEKVKIDCHQSGQKMIVEITNNDSVKIDEIEYVLLFMKGDNIVAFGSTGDVHDVPAGKTVTESVYCPAEQFDNYKIYINQAHTFGF